MRLKILISAVLVVVLGYSFFWYYMAGELEDRIEAWVSEQKSHGLSIRYHDLEINGFPYRMELRLIKLKVIRTGRNKVPLLMTSPQITLVAFPWKLNHGVIIGEGGTLRIGNRREPTLALTAGKLRASVLIDFSSRQFQQASLIIDKVTWTTGRTSHDSPPSEAQQVKLHLLRPAPSEGGSDMELPVQVKIYGEAQNVIAQEIPVGIFGKKADQVKIDLQIHGESLPTYSQESLAEWRDTGGTLAVKNFEIRSGEMDIELDGEVTLDMAMKPLGTFSAKIHGVDHIVSILGQHAEFQMPPANMILKELSRMNQPGAAGGKKVLDLPISLQNGLLFLGPIPVYELSPVVD